MLTMALLSLQPASAAELMVGDLPGNYPTIQSAIDDARDGDEILIAAGTWQETIDLLGKAIVLGPLDGEVILDADGAGSVIRCTSGEGIDTVIEDLVIRGGLAQRGAGLLTRNSTPTIRDCVFEANESLADGAAWAGDRGGPTFVGCLFLGNTAGEGETFSCGIDCTPLVLDCRFTGNCPQPRVDDWPVANASNLVEELPETCEQAMELFEGSTPFATVCAASERPGHAECELEGDAGTIANDIWYHYIAESTGLLRLSTCERSDFDTDLAVYRGGCDDLELVGCNDDAPGCPGGPSELRLPVRMGDALLIRLGGGVEGAAGTGRLDVDFIANHGSGIPELPSELNPRNGRAWIYVCPSGCDYTVIQDAIDAAANDDVVFITEAGTYYENLVIVGKQIVISGTYANGEVIIDGSNAGPVISAEGNANSRLAFADLTIQNGFNENVHGGRGGGISVDGYEVAIYRCTLTGNTALNGGGIGAAASLIYNDSTVFTGNSADSGGAIYGIDLIEFTAFNSSMTDNQGGAITLDGTQGSYPFRITRCNIERNTGDALNVLHAPLTCTNSLFAGNNGTGIRFDGNGAPLHILQCTIAHNSIEGDEVAGVMAGTNDWQLHNSILWGNQNDHGRTHAAQLSYDSLPSNALQHVSIEGNFDLTGGTTILGQEPWGDPIFEDPCGPDGFAGTGDGESYRLLAGSAALDAGDRDLLPSYIDFWDPDALGNDVHWFDRDDVRHDIDTDPGLSNPIGDPPSGPTPDLGCYEAGWNNNGPNIFVWYPPTQLTQWVYAFNWLTIDEIIKSPGPADSVIFSDEFTFADYPQSGESPTYIDHTVHRMHIGFGEWDFNGSTSTQLTVTDTIQIGLMATPAKEDAENPFMSRLGIGNGFLLDANDVLIDGYGNGELKVWDGDDTELRLSGTMTLVRGGRLLLGDPDYGTDIEITGNGTIENLEGVFERFGNATINGNYIQRTPPPGPLGQKYPTTTGAMIWNAGSQLTVTGTVELGGVLNMDLDLGRGGGAMPILECQTPGGLSGQVVLQTNLPSNYFFKVTTTSSLAGGTLLHGTITPLDLIFGLNGTDESNPTDLPIDAKLVDIDLDPDGLPDLAFVMDENLVVMFNQGDQDGNGAWDGFGSFGDAVTVNFPGSTPTALDVGDIDGKGPLDIVVSINAGPAAGSILVVQDITAPGPIVESVTLNGSADPVDVCLFDLDDDDDLDIIVASEADASLRLIENDGTRGGTRFPAEGESIPLPDSPPFGIDPSEEQDSKDSENAGILVSSRTADTGKFFRKSQGSRAIGLELEATVGMIGETIDMAVGDFDENGIEDFITLNKDTNSFSIFLREESDSDDFTELTGGATIDLLTFNSPVSVDTGDFDNDGDIDLVIVATPNGDPAPPPVARIWFNTRYANGEPVPSEWMTFVDSGSNLASSGTPVLVVAGDVDDVGGFPSQVGDDVVILGSATGLRNEVSTILPNVGGPVTIDDLDGLVTFFKNAQDGDTILLGVGTYVLDDRLDFGTRDLVLIGAVDSDGQPATTLVASASNRALWLTGGQSDATRIENIIIDGGVSGAGIYMENTANPGPILTNCIIRNCTWHDHGAGLRLNNAHPTLDHCVIESCICTGSTYAAGGGVYLYGAGSLTATDCEFRSNQAESGGAIYADQSTNTLLSWCDFETNTSSRFGGAVHVRLSATLTAGNCSFSGNSTSETDCAGGGIFSYGGDLALTNCSFSENIANDRGGGVAAWNGGTHVISNCLFDGNETTEGDSAGGGLYLADCTFDGDDNVFDANRSRAGGGAWFNSGITITDGQLTGWTFDGNLANVTPDSGTNNYAGALFINGSLIRLNSCDFTANHSSEYCGGVMVNNTNKYCTFSGCDFSNNTAGIHVGAVYIKNSSNTSMAGCTFTDNSATEYGGALYINASSTCYFEACEFTSNNAGLTGGALYIDSSSEVEFLYCTISGNEASSRGGGIHLYNSSPAIDSCWIQSNTAVIGGGISSLGSSNPTLIFTKVCGNTLDQINGNWQDIYGNCISAVCDTDGDGTLDCFDECPNDPLKIEPGVCGCGTPDTDSDSDGTPDCNDLCPNDPLKIAPGVCGCGIPDDDSDSDGVLDCNDDFPDDPDETTDSDGDGVGDNGDGCPDDPYKTEPGVCGCGTPDTDSDSDGIPDCIDCIDPDDPNDGVHAYPCEYTSIQAAIDAAAPGDVVLIDAGEYQLPAMLDFGTQDVQLIGESDPVTGEPLTVLYAAANSRTMQMVGGQSDATVLENIIIDGSAADTTSGIYMLDTASAGPRLTNCIIRNCTWHSHGAGLRLNNAHPTLVECTIESCTSLPNSMHGAAIYLFGGASVDAMNCELRLNEANSGGAIYADQDTGLVLDTCSFEDNTSTRYGGAIHIREDATITLICSTFSDNTTSTAGCSGGGIFSFGGSMTLLDTAFTGNTGHHHGGGVAAWNGGTHHVSDCGFTNNTTLDSISTGGGLYLNNCTLTGSDNTFTSNDSQDGGGAWFDSSVTVNGQLNRWDFIGNSASIDPAGSDVNHAGGLGIDGMSVILDDCEFTSNTSDGYCGGLFINNTSNCTIQGCDFTGNTTMLTAGAMYIDDTPGVVIQACTFQQNVAVNFSGAIHLWNSSPVIDGCTITGNQASSAGAMYCNGSSVPTVQNSTVCDNDLEQVYGSFVDIDNCISDVCDTDGDETFDCIDECPNDPLKTEPGVCGCGNPETDSDSDGTPDCNDECPNDPLKTEPGVCGCGIADTDSDSDGTPDCNDLCPNDPLKIAPGVCGCGTPDIDSDSDGVLDCEDGCPNDPFKIEPGICGCGTPDIDSDSDGVLDCEDGCPNDPFKIEPGVCGCGTPDIDSDSDGVLDCEDGCPNDPFKIEPGVCGCGTPDIDSDSDGVLDCEDGCPNDPFKIEPGICGCGNPETDTDSDGIPDCIDCSEPDDPNDGIHAYPCEYTSIQAAIDAAAPGDVVLIAAGTHELDSTINTNGRNITIRGELDVDGNPASILDGQGSQVIHCSAGSPGTTFEYLVIENGNATIGGGINLEAGSNITMDRCVIRNNSAGSFGAGGGFSAEFSSTATLLQCVIEGNTGFFAGGFYASGTVTLQGCIIRDNTASIGGGFYNDNSGTVSLSGTTMCGNTPNNFDGPGTTNDLGDNCLMESCDDSDGDGTYDCDDGCPDDPYKTEPGVCGCGILDIDSDGDSTPDCIDGCPSDPFKTEPGVCGCGIPDYDSDNDGTPDCNDGCPDDPDKIEPGVCGCGTPDTDEDGDGIIDCLEPACSGDLDGSNVVDVVDLLVVLADWGPCDPGDPCNADTNGDAVVDVLDLLVILSEWGECPLEGAWSGCSGQENIDESDFGCTCFVDGNDPGSDCNPGLDGDGTMTPYAFGGLVCASASIFQGEDSLTYRDTDWWDDDGLLDAGGVFTLQVASGAPKTLAIMDLDAFELVDWVSNPAGQWSDELVVDLPPGNYCLWAAPTNWTSCDCDSGLAEYSFRVTSN